MEDKKNKVLIIEDEIDLRELLKSKLIKEGFNVLEATDGKTGLDTALDQHPDMILLDVLMPVMDGLAMLKELRKDEWGKKVPVVILSNFSETEKISEGLEKNVYDYLVKSSWEPDNIIALIIKKLGKQK